MPRLSRWEIEKYLNGDVDNRNKPQRSKLRPEEARRDKNGIVRRARRRRYADQSE